MEGNVLSWKGTSLHRKGKYPDEGLLTLNFGICYFIYAWTLSLLGLALLCMTVLYCSLCCSTAPQCLLHTVLLCVQCGNCTPGSRSFSDFVDTWADSVPPAHTQASFKGRLYSKAASLQLIPIVTRNVTNMLFESSEQWLPEEGKELLQHSQLASFLCVLMLQILSCVESWFDPCHAY